RGNLGRRRGRRRSWGGGRVDLSDFAGALKCYRKRRIGRVAGDDELRGAKAGDGGGKGDRGLALGARSDLTQAVLRGGELAGGGLDRVDRDGRVLLLVLQVDKRELFGLAYRTNEDRAE